MCYDIVKINKENLEKRVKGDIMSNRDLVIYFKALSDETRLSILEILTVEELCACHILEYFDITQSTLSYHMKILVEAGLVHSRKDGNWTRYSINSKVLESIMSSLGKFEVKEKNIRSRCD